MADKDYCTIARPERHQIRIKRSVFTGTIDQAATRENAEEIIEHTRNEFHDATHNCFAYRIDESLYRFSDDGEPSGTAGRPILAMLDKHQLIRTVLIVTRYFGGVKLGPGGLARAYARCAEETIQKCKLKKFFEYQWIDIHYPYNLTKQVEYLVSKHRGLVQASEFGAAVKSRIKIPAESREAFEKELLLAGAGQIRRIEKKV